jgi:hypothetical protein
MKVVDVILKLLKYIIWILPITKGKSLIYGES